MKRAAVGIAVIVTLLVVVAPPALSFAGDAVLRDMAKEEKNPFSESVKLSLEFDTGFGIGPKKLTGENVNAQAVVPFSLTSDWNLITKSVAPVTYEPGPPDAFGLGDLQSSLFLSPITTGKWIWGIGPIFQFPTATDEAVGSGKWSAGPTAGLIYSAGPWLNGVLVSHLWSFAGDRTREDVNQTSIEVLLSYQTESGWYAQFDPVITGDWSAAPHGAWTVPVGLDVGKAFQIGSRVLSVQVGAYDIVHGPTGSAEYIVRGLIVLQFPRSGTR